MERENAAGGYDSQPYIHSRRKHEVWKSPRVSLTDIFRACPAQASHSAAYNPQDQGLCIQCGQATSKPAVDRRHHSLMVINAASLLSILLWGKHHQDATGYDMPDLLQCRFSHHSQQSQAGNMLLSWSMFPGMWGGMNFNSSLCWRKSQ